MPSSHAPRGVRVRSGFTLIELLVVIAIISLLVSILLPSLNRAKELAKTTLCVSNLKSIGSAFYLYAADYSDNFPVTRQMNGAVWPNSMGPQRTWHVQISKYTGDGEMEDSQDMMDNWYTGSNRRVESTSSILWGCSGFQDFDTMAAEMNGVGAWTTIDNPDWWTKTGYGMNVYYADIDDPEEGGMWSSLGHPSNTSRGHQVIDKWTSTSSRALVAEAADFWIYNTDNPTSYLRD